MSRSAKCQNHTPSPDRSRFSVQAAGICGTDIHIMKDEFRSYPPVVLGHEVAGEIVELGDGVTGLEPGMRVTTETYFTDLRRVPLLPSRTNNLCLNRRSIGSGVNGGFTNYVVVPSRNIHALPENIDFEAGALTEPLACVVHAVTQYARPSCLATWP